MSRRSSARPTHSPDEPARQPDYRRLYVRLHELECRYEKTLDFLMFKIRVLESRVTKLEARGHQ